MTKVYTPSSAGYTLIELVVVMLLLGILSLAAVDGVHFGARVWERSQNYTGRGAILDSTQNVLRTLVSQAVPRFQGEYVTFIGDPTSLSFDCIPPLAFAHSGIAHANLSLRHARGDADIVLRLSSIIETRLVKEAVLVGGQQDLRFAYLDASEGKPVWLSTWRDRDRLPDAVRISAATQSAPLWPELIIKPVLSEGADCELDPVSLKCRMG